MDKKIIWWLVNEWKIMPVHLISRSFGKSFIFHSNLAFFSVWNFTHHFVLKYKAIFLWNNKKSTMFLFNSKDETPMHLIWECNSVKYLWLQLKRHFHSDLTFPVLTPRTAFLGIFNDSLNNIHLKNHILLLFKLYI